MLVRHRDIRPVVSVGKRKFVIHQSALGLKPLPLLYRLVLLWANGDTTGGEHLRCAPVVYNPKIGITIIGRIARVLYEAISTTRVPCWTLCALFEWIVAVLVNKHFDQLVGSATTRHQDDTEIAYIAMIFLSKVLLWIAPDIPITGESVLCVGGLVDQENGAVLRKVKKRPRHRTQIAHDP